MNQALVGVIGGSGLYQMDALEDVQEAVINTPFGMPSDPLVIGRIHGVPVAFVARHGRGHRLLPSEVAYRANIYALKQLGVRYVLSVSAVGSLKEDFRPLDMVLPDQFIDLTRGRESTFFGRGAIAHFSMAQPVCAATVDILARAVRRVLEDEPTKTSRSLALHTSGTYVCIEGPQFSTQAESHYYRSMGAGVIGMTNMPEAKLAREAQMAYSTLAMVTDFDCWHPVEAHVTASLAMANLTQNASRAQHVLAEAIRLLGAEQPVSMAHSAMQNSLLTHPNAMSPETRERLAALLVGFTS